MEFKNPDELKEIVEVVYKPTNYEIGNQELKPEKEKTKPDTLFLYFCTITANVAMFCYGAIMVWTSPVIPKLQLDDPDVNPLEKAVTTYQISLLAGMPVVSGIFGSLSVGRLPDIIGPKRTLHLVCCLMVISNVAVAFGQHIYVYYVGRSLFYFATGACHVVLPIYIREICEDHNRGKYGCLTEVFLPAGNLYSLVVGSVTSIRNYTLLCTLPLLAPLTLLLATVPESPVYLATKGDEKRTIEALTKLRSNKSVEEIELDYISIMKTLEGNVKTDRSRLTTIFKTRSLRKALLIIIGVRLAQQTCGAGVIVTFIGPIFNEAGTQLSGNSVAIMVGFVKMCGYFLTTTVVEKVGRRPLLLFSSSFCGVPLFLVGLVFYWKEINVSFLESVRLLPVFCILIYIIAYSLGLGPIPLLLVGDLFPSDVRAVASSFLFAFVGFLLASITTSYPIAAEYFGTHICLWFFTACCFLGSIFVYFDFPETSGKSIQEIQENLNR